MIIAGIAAGASAFAGQCFSASFASGILGGMLTSVGYDHLVKGRIAEGLKTLREMTSSAAAGENHDLLRAIWLAQEQGLILCCETALLHEKGLRPGSLAIPVDLGDFEAWISGFGNVDAETKIILTLRRESVRRARRFEKLSAEDLARDTALALEKAPELFRSGSEFDPQDASELRTASTSFTLARLHSALPEDVSLPDSLRDEIEARWFDYLRLAFREALKRYPNAKSAFEFHFWEKVEGMPIRLDQALEILKRIEGGTANVAQGLDELRSAVESVCESLNDQHSQGREDLREAITWLDARQDRGLAELKEHVEKEAEKARGEFKQSLGKLKRTFEGDQRLKEAERWNPRRRR